MPECAEVRLGRHLARRLLPAVLLIGVSISAVPPAVYYVHQRSALDHAATIHAQDLAEQLRKNVIKTPTLWKYQVKYFAETLDSFVPHKGITAVRILDESEALVTEYRETIAEPRAWWAPRPPAGSAPFVFNNRRLGTVEVQLAPGSLAAVTLSLLVVSTVFGASLALFVYAYPVAIVRRAEGRILDLLGEVRRSNQELERQALELRARNADLDSFVYSVSHDLKAPLVAVHGMAGALAEDFGDRLDERGRHYVARLGANVERMGRLIQDLLALSRAGRETQTPEAVDLGDVVEDVLAGFAGPIRARGIKVSVGALGTLRGARTEVEQVMANLLGNAIKYLGDAPSPEVEVGTIDRGDVVECWVKDSGIGIDPAYHKKVFEIFQRLGEVEAEGTGVGLAIVKKIVEGMGGRIWVESAKGQGATFRFTWPGTPQGDTRWSELAR